MSKAFVVTLLDALYTTMESLPNRAALRLENAVVDLLDAPPSAGRENDLTLLCAPHPALMAALNVHLIIEAAQDDPRRSPILIYPGLLVTDDHEGQAM